MISGEAAFDQVLEAIRPVLHAHGLRLVDQRSHPQAFGSRYTTYGNDSFQIRLVWDGKEQWFVLEVDDAPGRSEWTAWADLTLQRFDQHQATPKWVDEIIGDVRAALLGYLDAGSSESSH